MSLAVPRKKQNLISEESWLILTWNIIFVLANEIVEGEIFCPRALSDKICNEKKEARRFIRMHLHLGRYFPSLLRTCLFLCLFHTLLLSYVFHFCVHASLKHLLQWVVYSSISTRKKIGMVLKSSGKMETRRKTSHAKTLGGSCEWRWRRKCEFKQQ